MAADDAQEFGESRKIFKNDYMKEIKIIFTTNLLEAGTTIPSLYIEMDIGIQMLPALFPMSNDMKIL